MTGINDEKTIDVVVDIFVFSLLKKIQYAFSIVVRILSNGLSFQLFLLVDLYLLQSKDQENVKYRREISTSPRCSSWKD